MNCFHRVLIFLPVLFVFSLSSCDWVKRTQVKSAIEEAQQKLKSGGFQNALDTKQRTWQPFSSGIWKKSTGTIPSDKRQTKLITSVRNG